MANYRRNFAVGGTYFFTVNLADRRRALLTAHIGLLRASFRSVRARHPFRIEAAVILPEHLHTIWTLPDSAPAALPKASAASGSAAIGSTRCGMTTISSVTSTTSISTR
jgi:hypothetical protein